MRRMVSSLIVRPLGWVPAFRLSLANHIPQLLLSPEAILAAAVLLSPEAILAAAVFDQPIGSPHVSECFGLTAEIPHHPDQRASTVAPAALLRAAILLREPIDRDQPQLAEVDQMRGIRKASH